MKLKKTIIAVCAIAFMAVIGAKASTSSNEEVQLKACGKTCSYTVGCSCTGFQRGTGDLWEKEYCKKCHHHRKYHRS